MKQLICILVVLITNLAVSATCRALYVPIALFDMVGSSDLVLVGTIGELRENTFVLKVETVVVGQYGKKTIEVVRFRNWTCASRWTAYATGQRVLVCLFEMRDDAGKTMYRIRSGGGEGEMPVAEEWVHCRYLLVPGVPEDRYEVHGVALYGPRFHLDDFVKTVQTYRDCFRFTVSRNNWPRVVSIEQTASLDKLTGFRDASPLAAHLVRTTLASPRMRNEERHPSAPAAKDGQETSPASEMSTVVRRGISRGSLRLDNHPIPAERQRALAPTFQPENDIQGGTDRAIGTPSD